jgi:hypothetical protein
VKPRGHVHLRLLRVPTGRLLLPFALLADEPDVQGYSGPLIVEDPADARLRKLAVLPPTEKTLTLLLGDTTVCKAPGFNDGYTFPPDKTGTVPWAGNGLFPGKYPSPTPQQLRENPINGHGHLTGTGPSSQGRSPTSNRASTVAGRESRPVQSTRASWSSRTARSRPDRRDRQALPGRWPRMRKSLT